MMLPFGWRSGVLATAMLGLVFVMGAGMGAQDVGAGERHDFHAMLLNETFDENGDLEPQTRTPDRPTIPDQLEQPAFDGWIDTPRLDRAIRERITEPMLRAGFRVAAWGYHTGYAIGKATAPWVVIGAANVYAAGLLVGWVWRTYRIAQEAG